MNDNEYVLNIPILINGGKGKPTTLEERELYIDTATSVLYCGVAGGPPKVISIGDLTEKVSDILKGNAKKEINNFVLKIPADGTTVNSFDDLKDKEPGVYFVKV